MINIIASFLILIGNIDLNTDKYIIDIKIKGKASLKIRGNI